MFNSEGCNIEQVLLHPSQGKTGKAVIRLKLKKVAPREREMTDNSRIQKKRS